MEDPIDYMIRRYHADNRMKAWIADKLGVSQHVVSKRALIMGLSFMHHGGRKSAPCGNGHNARIEGVDARGRCAKCHSTVYFGDLLATEDGRVVSTDEMAEMLRKKRDPSKRSRAKTTEGEQRRHDQAREKRLERNTPLIIELEDRLRMTPPYLREPIMRKLEELRS